MGGWSWDVCITALCVAASVGFAIVLLVCIVQEKAKTVPLLGMVCSLMLAAGVTLTAQLPNLLGGGSAPHTAGAAVSSFSPILAAQQKPAAYGDGSAASLPRMAYAESRMQKEASSANAEMTQAETRFQQETQTSSAAPSTAPSQSASSASGSDIRIVRAPGSVARGGVAMITVVGTPNTLYTLEILYGSGNSTGGRVLSVQSDTLGRASWAWTVGADTAAGVHTVTVTGGGKTVSTTFTAT